MREKDIGKNQCDPLPDEFSTCREAAEFSDTHDAGDYPEAWKPLDETIEFVEDWPSSSAIHLDQN